MEQTINELAYVFEKILKKHEDIHGRDSGKFLNQFDPIYFAYWDPAKYSNYRALFIKDMEFYFGDKTKVAFSDIKNINQEYLEDCLIKYTKILKSIS